VLPTSDMLVSAVREFQIANHPRIRVRGKRVACMYACVCMYCTYVYMLYIYICMYVCMYVCMCMCGGKRVAMTHSSTTSSQ
jgi:hypothetical protein